MKSLEYLNTHGQSSIAVTDNRYARVIFDRAPPLRPIDQVQTVVTTSVSVGPGVEIIDIIQPATADVRYRVKIITGGSTILASTIDFGTLPVGVTLDIVGSEYTLSGIETVEQWNQIKAFTWNLASNWASCQLWYLEIAVIYFDEATAADRTVSWLAYDELHYWVSEMTTAVTMSATVLRAKRVQAAITGESTMSVAGTKVQGLQAALSAQTSIIATGGIMVSSMNTAVTVSAKGSYNKAQGRATISVSSSLAVNPTYTYTDDLRFQIYHDSTRPTFAAEVQTYQTDLVVFWGDGSSTTYTGTGDYRVHNISKTYTGTGYKDIKVAASAVSNFVATRSPTNCYIYKIYNWSRVSAAAASGYMTAIAEYQIYLTEVPNYLPTNVTSLFQAFIGCTSLNDPNISSWDMSPITYLSTAFDGCTGFNQPVSSWDVSNCDNFVSLFNGCTSFNQPLPWTFKSGADLTSMLKDCTGFNQALDSVVLGGGVYNVFTSITMNQFMYGCTALSDINYNKFLVRLAAQVDLNTYGTGNYPRGTRLGVPAQVVETSVSYGSRTGITALTFLTNPPQSWVVTKA